MSDPTDDELRQRAADEFATRNFDEFVPAPIRGGSLHAFNAGWHAGLLAGRASVTQPQAYSIWTPLGDEPITLNTSREQLQAIANELQGINVYPGWAVFMGAEIERILKESLGVVPSTGNKEK